MRSAFESHEQPLLNAARSALAQVLNSASPSTSSSTSPSIVIALSGGRDSTVLLDVLNRLKKESGIAATAVHVHHGLHSQADAWAEHCRQQCVQRELEFEVRHVRVNRHGIGIEAAARGARYHALVQAAQDRGACAVLTAHHLDDRIETFLLQWLRGAGVDGLAAFPEARALAPGIALLRPFAVIERAVLERYAVHHGLSFVDDPSNADERLARNAVRHHLMPALAVVRPGFRKTTARSIALLAETSQLLDELARHGLAQCTEDAPARALRLDRLRTLSPTQQTLVLRHWLNTLGVRSPSRARLHVLLEQALHARANAQLQIVLGGIEIRRYRGLLLPHQPAVQTKEVVQLHWRGENLLSVPEWNGRLVFVADANGVDAPWLQAEPLQLRPRVGAERFKPHAARPRKTLKALFQEARVPQYERADLPLIWRQEKLIYVPHLGMDARALEEGRQNAKAERVVLQWTPEGR